MTSNAICLLIPRIFVEILLCEACAYLLDPEVLYLIARLQFVKKFP